MEQNQQMPSNSETQRSVCFLYLYSSERTQVQDRQLQRQLQDMPLLFPRGEIQVLQQYNIFT